MSAGTGYRGYIASRPIRHTSFPQRVQNLVVRSYAQRNGLAFKLSVVEYAMSGCYMMLATLLDELPKLDGVIVFSLFMLPSDDARRAALYERFFQTGTSLHAALEETVLRSPGDVSRFEDVIRVARALPHAPLHARFEKTSDPVPADDPFVVALTRTPWPG